MHRSENRRCEMEGRPVWLRAVAAGWLASDYRDRGRRSRSGSSDSGIAPGTRAFPCNRRTHVEHSGDRSWSAISKERDRNGLFPHWEEHAMKLLLLLSICAFAQDDNTTTPSGREQARSLVMTKFGIVATSQTLASAAGAR